MKDRNLKIVFISWQPYCSRSDNLASELGGKSFMVYYDIFGSNYYTIWLKYFFQTVKTLILLLIECPDVVIIMSPPIVACLPAFLYSKIFKNQFIIDAHTAAFLHRRWKDKKRLNSFFTKRALATAVTNDYLGRVVESWGGEYIILSDVPIKFPPACHCNVVKRNGRKRIITLVNTFAPDEPLSSFIEAAARFENIDFYITGKITRASKHYLKNVTKNVKFTDFLSDVDYGCLLRNSEIVCAFTTRNHTMLRGAYEAIYLERPIITSNWDLLKKKFPIGAVHVNNTVDGIASGIQKALINYQELSLGAKALKERKMGEWNQAKERLMDLMTRFN